MTREHLLIALGVVVALSPFSGLPVSILSWLLPLFGVGVALIGFSNKRRRQST